MLWEIIVSITFIIVGLIAGFWNPGHFFFTVLPGAALLWASITEQKKRKRNQNIYRDE